MNEKKNEIFKCIVFIAAKITDLDNAFVNITEITGYLKVVNSPQLLTLYFLRNLVTIRGDELVNDL